jgi:hypothetical protein
MSIYDIKHEFSIIYQLEGSSDGLFPEPLLKHPPLGTDRMNFRMQRRLGAG